MHRVYMVYALAMTAKRATMMTGVLVVIAAMTISCAPITPAADDLAGWMSDRQAEQNRINDAVATASAVVDAADATTVRDSDAGIRVALPKPESVSSFEFSCYGDGTMRFSVMLRQGSSQIGITTDDPLDCAASPHIIAAPDPAASVSEITFTGFDATNKTAWSATADR